MSRTIRILALVATAVALTACRMLFGTSADVSQPTATGVAPTPASSVVVPEGLPDPIGEVAYAAGEPVTVGGLTVTYGGTTETSDGLVSRFTVVGILAADARLITPGGTVVALSQAGDEVTSDPWPPAAPGSQAEITLLIDDALIPFLLGAVE